MTEADRGWAETYCIVCDSTPCKVLPAHPGMEQRHIPQVCPHCAQNIDIIVRGQVIYVSGGEREAVEGVARSNPDSDPTHGLSSTSVGRKGIPLGEPQGDTLRRPSSPAEAQEDTEAIPGHKYVCCVGDWRGSMWEHDIGCPHASGSAPIPGPATDADDPLAGLSMTGRLIVNDLFRQSRDLAKAHERLDIYAIPPGPIEGRLEWWFEQDSETLDQLIKARRSLGHEKDDSMTERGTSDAEVDFIDQGFTEPTQKQVDEAAKKGISYGHEFESSASRCGSRKSHAQHSSERMTLLREALEELTDPPHDTVEWMRAFAHESLKADTERNLGFTYEELDYICQGLAPFQHIETAAHLWSLFDDLRQAAVSGPETPCPNPLHQRTHTCPDCLRPVTE